MKLNQGWREMLQMIKHENIQNFLELTRLFNGNDYRILEGLISPDQITVLLQERTSAQEENLRWGIKMVLRKNHWTFETEKT
jgi:hypothetical protein